jgi:TPR repeat protein
MRNLISSLALAAALVLPGVSTGSDLVTAAGYAHDAGDYHIAAKLYRTAAELGDPRAQEMLGLMYLMGEENYGAIFPRDVKAAHEWFDRAAEQKSAFGMQMLNSLVLQQQATQAYPGDLADAAAVATDAVVYPGDLADAAAVATDAVVYPGNAADAAVDFVYPGDLSDAAAGTLYVVAELHSRASR